MTIYFRVPLHSKKLLPFISALSCLNSKDLFFCKVNQVKFKVKFDCFDFSQTILCANCPAPYYEVNLTISKDASLETHLEQFCNGYVTYLGIPLPYDEI